MVQVSASNLLIFIVLSLDPVAIRSPIGLQAEQYTLPLWCLCFWYNILVG